MSRPASPWATVVSTAVVAAVAGAGVAYAVARFQLGAALAKAELERDKERQGRISVQKRAREQQQHEKLAHGYTFRPIGVVSSPFCDRRGTPRQPILVPAARGKIVFDRTVVQHAHFAELSEFSHIWVIFVFHDNTNVDKGDVSTAAAKIKPPRLGGKKVGCLSTRSPHRPNPLGLSVFEVLEVGTDYIAVAGLDLCDGTPVLDVKPYIPYDVIASSSSSSSTVGLPMGVHASETYRPTRPPRPLHVPAWIVESDIPLHPVRFDPAATDSIAAMVGDRALVHVATALEATELITQVLRQDIRGVHQGRGRQTTAGPGPASVAPAAAADGLTSSTPLADYMCRLDRMEIRFVTAPTEIVVRSVSLVEKKRPGVTVEG